MDIEKIETKLQAVNDRFWDDFEENFDIKNKNNLYVLSSIIDNWSAKLVPSQDHELFIANNIITAVNIHLHKNGVCYTLSGRIDLNTMAQLLLIIVNFLDLVNNKQIYIGSLSISRLEKVIDDIYQQLNNSINTFITHKDVWGSRHDNPMYKIYCNYDLGLILISLIAFTKFNSSKIQFNWHRKLLLLATHSYGVREQNYWIQYCIVNSNYDNMEVLDVYQGALITAIQLHPSTDIYKIARTTISVLVAENYLSFDNKKALISRISQILDRNIKLITRNIKKNGKLKENHSLLNQQVCIHALLEYKLHLKAIENRSLPTNKLELLQIKSPKLYRKVIKVLEG